MEKTKITKPVDNTPAFNSNELDIPQEHLDEMYELEQKEAIKYINEDFEKQMLERPYKQGLVKIQNETPSYIVVKYNNVTKKYDYEIDIKEAWDAINTLCYKPAKNDYELRAVLKDIAKVLKDINQGRASAKGGTARTYPFEIADILSKVLTFKRIGSEADNSALYFYDREQGIYKKSDDLINSYIKILDNRFNANSWKDIKAHIRANADLTLNTREKYLIPVNNGIYNTKTKELETFTDTYIFTSKIGTDYNPNAFNPLEIMDVDKFMLDLSCNDEDLNTLLWQMINEAINANATRGKFFFLTGEGNNGKSTLTQLLVNLINGGKKFKNVATLQPRDFADKNKPHTLINKVANIADDINPEHLADISTLKSIVTGEIIEVERKYHDNESAQVSPCIIFNANQLPTTREKTYGLYRRMVIIPFDADFTGKENTRIKDEFIYKKEVLEYILKTAIELDFAKFIQPLRVQRELEEYKRENDYIREFIEDIYIPNKYHELDNIPQSFIKERLSVYVEVNRLNVRVGKNYIDSFIQTLEELTGYRYEKNYLKRYTALEWDLLSKEVKNTMDDLERRNRNTPQAYPNKAIRSLIITSKPSI